MSKDQNDKQYRLGQYMTPMSVAESFFKFIDDPIEDWRVLDPACGDGNLLIAAARRMIDAGLSQVAKRLCGVDIDPEMALQAKHRLSELLMVPPNEIGVHVGDYLSGRDTLFSPCDWSNFVPTLVLSNPPYGQGREYEFFNHIMQRSARGTRVVFLVPLAFMDRLEGGHVEPLDGRPLGVTTGHCLVSLTVGDTWRFKEVRSARANGSAFDVLTGVKVYEKGAGVPPQSDAIMEAKPYSSDTPIPGWLPCVRTGDVHPLEVRLDRQWIQWGDHLAHPKDLDRFTGPRLFVRRVPIWANRQLGAAYLEETALCAGDVLIVRHQNDDKELLRGLCVWLNSEAAALAVLARRPSVKHRMSFPKISAKDLNLLFDSNLPSDEILRSLARSTTPRALGVNESLGAFPIESVSDASVKEKSVRHGHLSTLQFWWARRPLATCRAVLYSLLRPTNDQLSAHPDLRRRLAAAMPTLEGDSARLDAFAGLLAEWSVVENKPLLELARDLMKLDRMKVPVVLDPFGGGGSIPVEALRLGLDAVTGELHPVAAAALALAVEYLPRGGQKLVDDYVRAAAAVRDRIDMHRSRLYPAENVPLAYLWCQTFRCPSCGANAPLLRDLFLARSPRSAVVKIMGRPGSITLRVVPIASAVEVEAASAGTVSDGDAKCAGCNQTVDSDFLRQEGVAHRLGDWLYAVHELMPSGERRYRDPTLADTQAAEAPACSRDVPSVTLDWNGVRHLWALQYGVHTTADLHSPRQQEALCVVVKAIREVIAEFSRSSHDEASVRGVALLLAVTLNRLVMYGNKHVWWQSNGEFPANIFVRQAISIVWSYVEMPITSPGAAGWDSAVDWIRKAAQHLSILPRAGRAFMADAANQPLENASVDIVFSDPPYYDSITYGYLADVFIGWMRAAVGDLLPGPLRDLPINRGAEAIVDRPHVLAPSPKGDQHFRQKMRAAFDEMRRVLTPGGVVVLMYGHKKTAAWAAFLEPLLDAGFVPVETWPVQTERKAKFRHNRISALSSSCLIICKLVEERPTREAMEWSNFEKRLMSILTRTVEEIERRGLHGADLGVALLAPAVAEWARFHVQDESGHEVAVSKLFERLPDLARRCELLSLEERIGAQEGRAFLEEIQAISSENHALASSFGKDVLAHIEALATGNVSTADAIAGRHPQARLLVALRLVALRADAESRQEQLALASVGRISMQRLGQLPGSGYLLQ